MAKFLKTVVTSALCAILVATTALFIGGCNKQKGSTADVKIFDTPRTVYVLGQDLDKTVGSFISVVGDKATEIKFTDSKVSFSGYDNTKLGTQKVSVKYGGKTFTYEITVIDRLTVENFVTDYFVGDELDLTKGSVKVADDKGVQTSVSLSDSRITVTGFDSSSTGKKTLTVTYNGDGNEYSTQIEVTVHGEESVKIVTDGLRSEYFSHETIFDCAGGYIVISSQNGGVSQRIDLTPNMVEGFDPSDATAENTAENPYEQVVFIVYGKEMVPFTVEIVYSDVTVIQAVANHIINVTRYTDWFQSDISAIRINKDIGEQALGALKSYFNFDDADKALFTEEQTNALVRYGYRYALDKYDAEKDIYDAIEVSYETGYTLNDDATYEQVKNDLATLQDEDLVFNSLIELLYNVRETFGNVTIGTGTIDSYIARIPVKDEAEMVTELFELMIYVYDEIDNVPTEWEFNDLETNKTHIINAALRIVNSKFVNPNLSGFFRAASSWRENDDLFDIIYYYYVYGEGMDVNTIFISVCRPEPIEQLFLEFNNLFTQLLEYYVPIEDGKDNTVFYVLYNRVFKLYDEIMSGDNQFYKDILIEADFINLVLINVGQNSSNDGEGFYSFAGGVSEDEDFIKTLSIYTDIMYDVYTTEYDPKTDERIELFMQSLLNLSPATQYGFFASLYQNYGNDLSRPKLFRFEYDETNGAYVTSDMGYVISSHYSYEEGNGNVNVLLYDILMGLEFWAMRSVDSSAETSFIDVMKYVGSEAKNLTGNEKTYYETNIKPIYDVLYTHYENLDVYNATSSNENYGTFTETVTRIEKLTSEIRTYASKIKAYVKGKIPYDEIALLISAYEELKGIKTYIYENASDEILDYYRYYKVSKYNATYDYEVYNALNLCNEVLTDVTVSIAGTKTNYARSVYFDTDAKQFMAEAYDILLAGKNGTLATASDINWVLNSLSTISEDGFIALSRIGALDLIHRALEVAIEDFSAEEKDFVSALFAVQDAYVEYLIEKNNPQNVTAFKEAFELATEKKTAVAEGNNYTQFFKTTYEFYLEIYESLAE